MVHFMRKSLLSDTLYRVLREVCVVKVQGARGHMPHKWNGWTKNRRREVKMGKGGRQIWNEGDTTPSHPHPTRWPRFLCIYNYLQSFRGAPLNNNTPATPHILVHVTEVNFLYLFHEFALKKDRKHSKEQYIKRSWWRFLANWTKP